MYKRQEGEIPLNYPAVLVGLSVEVTVKVPSRYYRVPRYFFTVLTVAQNRWYRSILLTIRATVLMTVPPLLMPGPDDPYGLVKVSYR